MNLQELIKLQIDKANSLFSEKDNAEREIKQTFNTIKDFMPNEIEFIYKEEFDNYGDIVTTIYASNPSIENQYILLTYDFDNKSIFPLKISIFDGENWLCQCLKDVKSVLREIVSKDDFMVRLISISKEKGDLIDFDDIPF
ncbi:hypothetical protein A9Z41_06305 [Enterobacter cloacae]|nr:hypothetical protein A9Z41_06305 [Enterobacter cloacae]